MSCAKIESVADAEMLARRRVPPGVFQLFEGGSGAGVSLRRNVAAFHDVMFRPRNAVSMESVDVSTTVLGDRMGLPLMLAPVGFLRAAHPDGEIGATRAAATAGIGQIISGVTTTPIEEIVAAASGPIDFQMYYFASRARTEPVLDRVREAGVRGLVLTVDAPVLRRVRREVPYPRRRQSPRSTGWSDLLRFGPQAASHPRWAWDMARRQGLRLPEIAMAPPGSGHQHDFWSDLMSVGQQTPSWSDLEWLRRRWSGPVIVKGILRVDDAMRAVAEGADAIVVSNHGGNELDGTVAPLRALEQIADSVGDRVEVLFDSGVRRGSDAVKALALGAKAVLLGRAYLYPLMAGGGAGVDRILQLFAAEIRETLHFLGAASLTELDRSLVDVPSEWSR